MKAIILAAGFGTRLLPFTDIIPKCLFPIAGRPLLDIIISGLQQADCREIIINTHHLPQKIDSFVAAQNYSIPITTRYEPKILDTGGAIKNAADFWDDQPFMAINSDIITDISLNKVYRYHLKHKHPATLVLYDDEQFNTVAVNEGGDIYSFQDKATRSFESKKFTFTGVQVLDPSVLAFIRPDTYSDIIDTYKKLMTAGNKIRAFVAKNFTWNDIGTPERYKNVVIEETAPAAFRNAFGPYKRKRIERFLLRGDGSDRIWYRLVSGNYSLIMADHGIKADQNISEIDSYLAIGNHLYHLEIPVPKIYCADTFAGLVFMEDLGDLNLQALVGRIENSDEITRAYMSVINLLVRMAVKGAAQFDSRWAYQTSRYSPELVVEKECRYFVDTFLNGFLKLNIGFETLEDEFKSLAEHAVESGINGFMHRDFQSRNIMVHENNYYFIDFQGGRIGPVQYDLASLLIDPYVELPGSIQAELVAYGADKLSDLIRFDKKKFYRGYEYCAITRNLQILGAFGFLSRQKGKKGFELYIPPAVKSLKTNLDTDAAGEFPKLKSIAESL